MNKQLIKSSTLSLLVALHYCPAYAETQQNAKHWDGVFITGPLSEDQKLQYYMDGQLRFIKRSDIFDQTIGNLGIGYQSKADLSLWLGGTWVLTNDPIEGPEHEYRVWQQANWRALTQPRFTLDTRTRFEQRKDEDAEEWALRLRHKETMTVPISRFKGYSLVLADEIFFNINHPQWINNNQIIDQNRASIGIAIPASKKNTLEVGYLNQYLIRDPNQMYHILYINLRINSLQS